MTSLSDRLKRVIASKERRVHSAECRRLEETEFQACMNKWLHGDANETTKRNSPEIPKFYSKLPKENEPIRRKLLEESRSNLLKRKSLHFLDKNELTNLWILLEQHQTSDEEQLITYDNYLKVADMAGPKVKPYFVTTTFAKLQQGDRAGRISIMSLFNYVMRKVWLQQTRMGLSLYDSNGQGYLTENDLKNYITELIPNLSQLEGLEQSFYNFYVCTAVRKFFFFLDVLKTGRIKILDILGCSFLDDLLELGDDDVSKDMQEQNWFSAPSALRIYGHYLNLDRDHNGMLNKTELAGYGSGTLTQPFLDRVFQTCLTYSGEMDYKTYLDLVLALENRSEPQALAFLFKILDIKGQGYLDSFTLNFFFRAIQDQMQAHGVEEVVSFEDVKDELFDMARPKDPHKITLGDLMECGQGDTFVSILIEFHGFWAYENRESVTAEPI